ncbi:hypothetical protein ACEQPO_24775 [Bacillus sp. SL00103]
MMTWCLRHASSRRADHLACTERVSIRRIFCSAHGTACPHDKTGDELCPFIIFVSLLPTCKKTEDEHLRERLKQKVYRPLYSLNAI